MPQMSPMLWFFLYVYFLALLFLMLMILYTFIMIIKKFISYNKINFSNYKFMW